MTKTEAIELLREYAECQGSIWSGSPEGQKYMNRFNEAISTLVATCEMVRPQTPVGWSDTDWIKHLQDHEGHPLMCLHINKGSMDAAAEAYELEYNAWKKSNDLADDAGDPAPWEKSYAR